MAAVSGRTSHRGPSTDARKAVMPAKLGGGWWVRVDGRWGWSQTLCFSSARPALRAHPAPWCCAAQWCFDLLEATWWGRCGSREGDGAAAKTVSCLLSTDVCWHRCAHRTLQVAEHHIT